MGLVVTVNMAASVPSFGDNKPGEIGGADVRDGKVRLVLAPPTTEPNRLVPTPLEPSFVAERLLNCNTGAVWLCPCL